MITFNNSFLEVKIFLYWIIKSDNFLISASISFIPKAVSFCNLNSKIEFTWSIEKEYTAIVFFFSMSLINFWVDLIFHFVLANVYFAISGFFEFLIILIILSIFSTATERPIKMWALSSAFFKSNFVFFVTTSSLNFRKDSKKSFKLQFYGFLSTIAKVLKLNEDSKDEYL